MLQDLLYGENIHDVQTLQMLTRSDLRELGLRIGDYRRLMVYLDMGDEVRTSSCVFVL